MKTKAPVDAEKQIALSNHIFAHSFAVLFGFLGASFGLAIDEIIFAVFGVLIILIFIFLLLISPTHYIFSNESVVICHPFKRRETIYWEDIRSINKYGSWFYHNTSGLTHYKIYYRHEKEVLFLNGEICRSRKTKKLLQKYYKGNVE